MQPRGVQTMSLILIKFSLIIFIKTEPKNVREKPYYGEKTNIHAVGFPPGKGNNIAGFPRELLYVGKRLQ